MTIFLLGYASEQVRAALCNSLPELGDGGGEVQVGGVGSHPKGFVLADGVLDAAIGVPGLIALGPGQLRPKTLKRKTEAFYLFCDVDFCENIAHPESDTCNALQTSSGDENSPGEQVLWQQVIGVMKGETSKDSVVHKQGRSENTLSLLHRLGNTSENCCR